MIGSDDKIQPTDLPEVITTLYLRLNGFFTSGLVLHSEVWGQDSGDVDCLAVWHPFHDQSEREVAPDPFLDLGARRELLVCEVKSSTGALSFNERLRADPRAMDSALRWSGLIPPEQLKDTVDRLLPLPNHGIGRRDIDTNESGPSQFTPPTGLSASVPEFRHKSPPTCLRARR